MKNAVTHMEAILERIEKNGCVLMLDFDGTLAPIVASHSDATMSSRLRILLHTLAKEFPLAIISGRSLLDLRKRVSVKNIAYAGSHGLEIQIGGRRASAPVKIPRRKIEAFARAKQVLKKTALRYPLVTFEKKRFGYALHYRKLGSSRTPAFLREAKKAISAFVRSGYIKVINDIFTFDIMPNVHFTKEHAARLLFNKLKRNARAVPVYIGDSLTDEDAFRALHDGITIRVGNRRGSAARYYFKSRRPAYDFLLRLKNHAL